MENVSLVWRCGRLEHGERRVDKTKTHQTPETASEPISRGVHYGVYMARAQRDQADLGLEGRFLQGGMPDHFSASQRFGSYFSDGCRR